MEERELVGRIRAALEHDRAINVHAYPIDIRAGESITLAGTVADIVAKRRAAQIARQVASSIRIRDELRIDVARHRPDTELADAVIRRLHGELAFLEIPVGGAPPANGPAIAVTAGDDVATLAGTVPSIAHRRLAEVLAWWTPGVGDVDNRLHVYPPEEDSDEELTDVLRQVMEMDPSIDAARIGITVRDRGVTLTGVVHDDVHRRIAVRNCWYVPGVHGVGNRLSVVAGS
ncbi:BON domain-containing protein [Arhodomonas sp. AD133]|uniref:BON domain-containing protein n=1 Tax=Arhodomonas sp. AD133 TaxID=3415009 RepID=UPI003EB90DA8